MGKRVAVLINPTAGRGRAVVVGREVREQLMAAGHEVVDVTGANAVAGEAKLRTALATLVLDAVVVVGGDGVVNLAASAVVDAGGERPVPLAIIPAGTGDDIARGLGISRKTHHDVSALLDSLSSDRPTTRAVDVARLSGGTGGPRYFLSVLTVGLDAAVNARANAMKFPRGKARYLFALLAELRRYRAYDYELRIGGAGEAQRRALIVACVANLPYFGGGMKISPASKPDDGKLQIVLVPRVPLPKLLWIFPRIFWGGHVKHRAVEVVETDSITITWGHGQEPPPPFADGEPAGAKPLEVTMLAGALQIIELG